MRGHKSDPRNNPARRPTNETIFEGWKQCGQTGWFIAIGQLFKACGNNYFAQIVHIIMQFL